MSLSKHDATHLARECLKEDNGFNYPDWVIAAQKLSRMFLSGDMKREIENAAFDKVDELIFMWPVSFDQAGPLREAIRSLIQPPAQKENGE